MKNTKKTRRVAAFAAAVMMAACVTVPMSSFSASAEGSISISNEATGHTYEAYQIFDGDLSDGVLSNIIWGVGIDDTKQTELLAAINAITLTDNSKPFETCADAAAVAKVLSDANAIFDAEITKKFASVVGQYLGTPTGSTTGNTYTISNLDDGYYLVKDKDDTLSGVDDSKTRYIVEVLGNKTNISPKSSKPSVMKKVQEGDLISGNEETTTFAGKTDYAVGDGYNDVADYSIGDAVPFKLYGTLPSTLGDYTKYKYVFHDTLGTEFTAPAAKDVKVYIDGDETSSATVDVSGQNITVTFNDIIDAGATKDSIVTVAYNAVLNANAQIGLPGQRNEVYLTYSNNPNWVGDGTGGSGDTPSDDGKTPKDEVIVFTYELDTTKVDGADNTKKLANAEFKLQAASGTHKDKWAIVTDGKLSGWSDTEDGGTTLKSDANGLFKVAGLEDGTYSLKETKAPTGYNLLADPIEVVLTADTANGQNWDDGNSATALTALTVTADNKGGTVDDSKGIASISIANNKGSTLPSTGGIGTTLFYVGGGVLVAGAGVLLITKKRAKKDAE